METSILGKFNSKFDEYRAIYFPTSTVDTNNTLNNDDDNDDDDLLFSVSKQARYSNSYEELNYYLESSPEPTIPATSAPVERIFSESGNIITPERNWLGSGTIKATFTVVSVAANFAIGIFWISQYLCEFHVGAVGVA
ncbi:hypothetical protein C2G38_2227551 [Gigaspora rosea]|uniref:HAT C-terminal dimerisation domain-containing protein n=1 Tax=Gigaspora rosea TaxID=44941 RepID=A0A397U185_9GLOM|nr:hypothetical protein C2G38_2227551 [Gigaspora rosea]